LNWHSIVGLRPWNVFFSKSSWDGYDDRYIHEGYKFHGLVKFNLGSWWWWWD